MGGEGPQNAKEVRPYLWLTWGQLKPETSSTVQERRSAAAWAFPSEQAFSHSDEDDVNNICRPHDLEQYKTAKYSRPNCKAWQKEEVTEVQFQATFVEHMWNLAHCAFADETQILFQNQLKSSIVFSEQKILMEFNGSDISLLILICAQRQPLSNQL